MSKWYNTMGLKLLENDSYVEAKPDHVILLLTMRKILDRSRSFLSKQQYNWLAQPCVEEPEKIPVLKVLPNTADNGQYNRPVFWWYMAGIF
jgi:hypothetical protein